MLEGERLSPCDGKKKKQNLKTKASRKQKSQMRRPSRCHEPETKSKTEPSRTPKPNQTRPGRAWQQVADAAAAADEDHEDHRRVS